MTPLRFAGRDLLGSILDLGPVTARQHAEWLGTDRKDVCKTGARLVEAGQLRRVQHRPARWDLSPASVCLPLTYHDCRAREGAGGLYGLSWAGACRHGSTGSTGAHPYDGTCRALVQPVGPIECAA